MLLLLWRKQDGILELFKLDLVVQIEFLECIRLELHMVEEADEFQQHSRFVDNILVQGLMVLPREDPAE
jgi:hypothetical protein